MILKSRWLNKNIILNSTMNDKEENLMEKEDRVVCYRKLCEEIQRMINDLPVLEGNCVQIEKAKSKILLHHCLLYVSKYL